MLGKILTNVPNTRLHFFKTYKESEVQLTTTYKNDAFEIEENVLNPNIPPSPEAHLVSATYITAGNNETVVRRQNNFGNYMVSVGMDHMLFSGKASEENNCAAARNHLLQNGISDKDDLISRLVCERKDIPTILEEAGYTITPN